ncbi:four helix bundle protein [Ekhidna sp.]
MKNFKQLLIWQKGMEIWKEVYVLSKDFARFLQIALGSSFELETFLVGIKMLELNISENEVDHILQLVDEEQKMIMSFKKKIVTDS